MDFKRYSIAEMISMISSNIAAIVLAFLGYGVWSDLSQLKKLDRATKEFKGKLSAKERKARNENWHRAVDASQVYAKL